MNKFFTLPNILTVSRVFVLPIFALGFFIESRLGAIISFSIFVLCCATDYLDGYYARMYKQTSKIGRMLDPLADKILISISILFIVGFDLISGYTIIAAAIILCREVIISGVRDVAETSERNFKTSLLSKWKTASQMFSVAIVLLSNIGKSVAILKFGEIMFWTSSIIAIVSGITYCQKYLSKSILAK
ncbi:MAG: CDP-diacylglycerol--glycerol-3-phosphate 3-phosphatidyltransferase [Holosporales bacterium]|jgi:cardiolipin synthase|nr:CDP-diacylglycerol--glycerol-3-phosphate 3-phosphatidyltransferase [Holosporales bacterium]